MALGGGSGGGSARGIRAGSAYVELNGKDNISGFMNRMKGKIASAGKAIAATAALALAGGLGLAVGALTAVTGPLLDTIQDLGKLDATAKAFGLTGREASGLFGVLQAGGSDIRDATEGLVTLGQRVTDAMSGTGEEAAELFSELGVGAEKFAGLNPAEQFYKLHESLLAVQDPAKRVQLLLKAVGEDTGKNLINTLSMSNAELRGMADKLAFSNAELRSAAEAAKAYQSATLSVTRAWQQVAVVAAPLVRDVAQWVERGADGFTGWIKGRDAANVLAEVWVRIKQGLFEIQAFGEDSFGALWDYFTENAEPAIEVVKQLFSGLFKFAVGAFAKIFPIWTKYAAAGVAAILATAASPMLALGMSEGQQLMDVAKSIDPTREAKRLAEQQAAGEAELVEAMKGFDQEREKLAEKMADQQEKRAAERVENRKELADELAAIQAQAEVQRNTAAFAEHMQDLMRPDIDAGSPVGEKLAGIGRSITTFGTPFLKQAYSVQSASNAGKDLIAENKKHTKLLEEIVKKPGLVFIGP